jgi:amidase
MPSTSDEILNASAVQLARALAAGTVSALEVVECFQQRIAAVNPVINAVVQQAGEWALTEARAADAARARGELLGPLHGVPFTVKDTFDVAGLVGAMGIAERATFTPQQDATVVSRLRAAGGIVLGKTNVPPWGGGIETDNPVYGRTNNPYDLSRTPGGSSGGEAAIIAAAGSPFGVGSDSGGSLRLPAHDCGIATIKPTAGRVPTTNAGQTGDLSDPRTQVGLLSRRVEDLAFVLPLITGMDWFDAAVVPVPMLDPAAVDLVGLRVAFYTSDGVSEPTAATVETIEGAARALEPLVARVEEQRPPGLDDAWPITQGYWDSVIAGTMPTRDFYGLLRRWGEFRSRMLQFLQHWEAIICPVAALPAVPHGTSINFTDARMISYTVPYSLTGWPVVVVRCGTSREGLPIGVQVVAQPWREDIALALAQQLETALGGWQPPPPT